MLDSGSANRGMSRCGAWKPPARVAEGAADNGWRRASLDRCDQPILKRIPTRVPSLRAHVGRNLSSLAPSLAPAGIADDKLDSEKMPEAVLPPGCRRPVDLPPTARAVMRVSATRSGEYEKRTIKTRSALSSPSAQCPFLAAPARLPVLSRRCRCSLCG